MTLIAGNHVAPKRRRRKRDGRDILLIVFAVIAVVAVLVAVWAIATRNRDAPPGNETQSTADTTEPVEKLTDSIDLPGYGALNFKADVLEQDVTLPNPERNFCWIKISLYLEDGTLLWVSDLIAPGESSAPIVLSTPLAAGEYKNAVLKYECFRMDEALTPLNGATTNLTIKVK